MWQCIFQDPFLLCTAPKWTFYGMAGTFVCALQSAPTIPRYFAKKSKPQAFYISPSTEDKKS